MTILHTSEVKEIENAVAESINEIHVEGGISQNIAKGIEAWHKFRQTQHKLFIAMLTAVVALGFGPVGWVFGGLATLAILFLMQQKKEAERAYRSAPFAVLARQIAKKKYFVSSNDGTNIILMKE